MSEKRRTVQVIIPKAEFCALIERVHASGECHTKWCPYTQTGCYLNKILAGCQDWWKTTNGDAPGFACYEAIFKNSINFEDGPIYWSIFAWRYGRDSMTMASSQSYNGLVETIRRNFR